MTELLEAVADAGAEGEERRLLRVAAAVYEMSQQPGVRQRDLVMMTGLSRETIRRYVEDERIRRGLINPTPRYIKEQERKGAKKAAAERAAAELAAAEAARS